ncbi:small ubiquitin-related modifier 3-like isoform X1 [Oryzias melastigma]|uniref:small ubiquitin-related modifier 3-like isoform X1 n=1 Tax=Oryzias melastigma TaxID=30732 RepID=UPI000CF810F4|nr:small ubiquitin-related modifier 3-like isoform X1 [Oryzias melastigma]
MPTAILCAHPRAEQKSGERRRQEEKNTFKAKSRISPSPVNSSDMSEEKPKEGVKTENDHINLKVAGQDGSVVQFKIKRHTPLSKLMKAYCERQVSWKPQETSLILYQTQNLNISLYSYLKGLSIRQIRFRFDGQPINETDTPAQLEMEDEDTIDVFQQQTGGKC